LKLIVSSFGSVELKKGEIYTVSSNVFGSKEMAFLKSYSKNSGGSNLQYLEFVDKKYYNLINNIYNHNQKTENVSFKNYVDTQKNQFRFYLFELRKKGLLQTLNKEYNTEILHFIRVVKSLDVIEINAKDNRFTLTPFDIAKNKQSYYSIDTNNNVIQTNKGVVSRFIPFLSKLEIDSLSLYIKPVLNLSIDNFVVRIGSIVSMNNAKYIALEVNTLYIGSTVKSDIVLGVIYDSNR